ncbi:MAG: 50S ribosomal protein L9, partial [Oscillospiraceae bacterium]|nr:50S ribosomal protein L9 [Oscillospiraceae bacterium]
VADAQKEQSGIELEKNRLLLEENIQSFGSYELRCKLGYEVSGTIHLLVVEG